MKHCEESPFVDKEFVKWYRCHKEDLEHTAKHCLFSVLESAWRQSRRYLAMNLEVKNQ
jgi:hypothetical protein